MIDLKITDDLTKDDIFEINEMENNLFLVIIKNTATDNHASIILTKEQIRDMINLLMENSG